VNSPDSAGNLNRVRLSGCSRHNFVRVPEHERRGERDDYVCTQCRGTATKPSVEAYLRGIRIGRALDPDAAVNEAALARKHLSAGAAAADRRLFQKGVLLGIAIEAHKRRANAASAASPEAREDPPSTQEPQL
jgi:hypothetical protein